MALLILSSIALAISYLVSTSIYNLFFHPLRNFPGPKLAAATHIYEFYFDCLKGGKFMWEIQRMHEAYGIRPPQFTPRDTLTSTQAR
jgi:hypothetical protein